MLAYLAAASTVATLVAAPLSAAVLFEFEESGGDVVGTLSGSLDCDFGSSSSLGLSALSTSGALVFATEGGSNAGTCQPLSAPSSFGSGGFTIGSHVGDTFGAVGGPGSNIFLPEAYTGGSLSGTLTFAGETFDSLGAGPGDYVFTLPRDTVTIRFSDDDGTGTSPIPLPATLPLLAAALGIFAIRRPSGTPRC